ncbi:thioredoxin domain-containing protein 2-like [Heptranchias perlo]|uniref:thioredoxin domain-containing protein 2-like n=1 Tax=Heptranchias perlo TaxID=212740 RepID=UPI003559418B
MAGAGSTLGKPKKAQGKSAQPTADKAAPSQAPGEVGPSHGKAGRSQAKASEPGRAKASEPSRARASEPSRARAAEPPQEKGKPPKESKTPDKAQGGSGTPQELPGDGVPLRSISSMSEFDKFIKEAGERLVVIFFSGNWCETCQDLKPIMSEIAQLHNLVIFYEVNVDDSEDTAEACDIIHIPTFQFYKMGKKVAEILDDSRESVEDKIKELK